MKAPVRYFGEAVPELPAGYKAGRTTALTYEPRAPVFWGIRVVPRENISRPLFRSVAAALAQ